MQLMIAKIGLLCEFHIQLLVKIFLTFKYGILYVGGAENKEDYVARDMQILLPMQQRIKYLLSPEYLDWLRHTSEVQVQYNQEDCRNEFYIHFNKRYVTISYGIYIALVLLVSQVFLILSQKS